MFILLICGIMDIKLEERLFPFKVREHNVLCDKDLYYRYKPFNEHLEIDKLEGHLLHLIRGMEVHELSKLIYNLETDLQKIIFRQDLSKYLLEQPTLLEKLSRIEPIHIEGSEEHVYSPMKVFKEYKHEISNILEGIESVSKQHPYFAAIQKKFMDELELIVKAEKSIETHYELRADFHAHIKKERKYPNWKGNLELTHNVKIDDNYTVFVSESIREKTEFIRKKKTKELRNQYSNSLNICGVNFRWSEITEGIIAHAKKILSANNYKFKENETVDMHRVFNVEQKSLGKYETTGIYTLQKSDKVMTETIHSKSSQGLPFHLGFFNAEEYNVRDIIEPIAKKAKEHQRLFEDLMNLAAHAKLSKELLSRGATFAEYSTDPSQQIVMKNMRCPLLMLQKYEQPKEIIPNDVNITNEGNVVFLTGAGFNGKSTYGIAIAQNLVLAQASLPGFFSYGKIHPRSQFLTLFSDYKGNMESGESKHTKDCVDLRKVLENIIPHSYVFIDEVGTGTDPQEGKELGYEIFESLANLKDVAVVGSTHYKDMVRELVAKYKNISPIAFNFDKNNKPTYKGLVGQVATTSAGRFIAEQRGLGEKDFDNFKKEWEEKGWTRK